MRDLLADTSHLASWGQTKYKYDFYCQKEPSEVEAAWTFLRSGAVTVDPIDDVDMSVLLALMKKDHDRPMDFAEATLVQLAQRLSLQAILTADFNDFETYRIDGCKRFRIFPSR